VSGTLRVGVGGPVGSGKTALIERVVPLLVVMLVRLPTAS